MASLESLNGKLRIAADALDRAAEEIRELSLEPTKENIRSIGEALGNIFEIQHTIYKLRPDLKPDYLNEETPQPDPDLSTEEKLLVEKLSSEELENIDKILLSHTKENWQKVAKLVGLTMIDLNKSHEGVPDIFYAQRVKKLVENSLLESQGDLQYMRFSEVRLTSVKK